MPSDADLQAEAASYVLRGDVVPVRTLIDRAIDEGLLLDEFFVPFFDLPNSDRAATDRAFRALLGHRGIAMPDEMAAIRIRIAVHAARIADERLDARAELQQMIDDIYRRSELRTTTVKYLGDGFGIQQLIGNHWSFDDLEERPDEVSCGGHYALRRSSI